MGRDKNEARKGRLSKLGRSSKVSQVADYSGIDSTAMQRLVAVVASRSGAVRYGYTRDGGAYAVGIYLEGESETLYFKPTEDVSAELDALADEISSNYVRVPTGHTDLPF